MIMASDIAGLVMRVFQVIYEVKLTSGDVHHIIGEWDWNFLKAKEINPFFIFSE
jgi:hypothetical protein